MKKRLLSILLVAAMACSMLGCASGNEETENTESSETELEEMVVIPLVATLIYGGKTKLILYPPISPKVSR